MYNDISSSMYKNNFSNKEALKQYWVETVESTVRGGDTSEIEKLFDKNFRDPKLEIKNTATGRTHNVDGLRFLYNVYDKNMIITENGVFFNNQRVELPPSVDIEIQLGDLRGKQKKLGNYYLTEGADMRLGTFYDRLQNGSKTMMNTYYGILLNKFSKFFNPDLASSITCRGRSTVSVSALTVESVLGGYFPKAFNALIAFIRQCCTEASPIIQNEWHVFINARHNKTVEDVIKHFGLNEDYYMIDAIRDALSKCNQAELNLMFFKNNIEAFIDLPEVNALLLRIAKKINEEQHAFLDPNEIPEFIEEEVNHLIKGANTILNGYYWYQGDKDVEKKWETVNTQETIKTILRKHIALIDTDSNMIAFRSIRRMFDNKIEHIMRHDDRISAKDGWYSTCNLIMTIVDRCIDTSLKRYTDHVNMVPEFRNRIKMKNEFLYNRFVLTSRKKNYFGSSLLKEGKAFPKPKADVKGLMFMKSNVNTLIGDMVKDILTNDIIMAEKIDVRNVLTHIHEAKETLRGKMKTQEGLDFFAAVKLDTSKKIKNPSDYRIVAMDLWNILHLGDEIVPPTSFLMVQVDLNLKMDTLMNKYPEKLRAIEVYLEQKNDDQAFRFKSEVLQLINMVGINQVRHAGFDVEKFTGAIPRADIIKASKGVFNFITKALCEQIILNCADDKLLVRHAQAVANNKYKMKDFFSYGRACDRFENIANFVKEELTHTNPDAKRKIGDIGYIAMPLDSIILPEFILDVLNVTPVLSQIDSLAAPIVRELHLAATRNKDDRVILSNIITYF